MYSYSMCDVHSSLLSWPLKAELKPLMQVKPAFPVDLDAEQLVFAAATEKVCKSMNTLQGQR